MIVTNPATNDSRVINEASSLYANGYDVTVLAIKNNNTLSEEYIKGYTVKRLSRWIKSNSIFGKLEFTLKFTLMAIKQRADIFHAHDLSTLLECYLAAKITHAKVIYDSHELYMDPIDHGFGHWLYSVLEKSLIKRVDNVITVNRYIAKFLENHYKLNRPVFVIMNCPSLKQDIYPTNPIKNSKCLDELRAEKRKNKKIIVYQGLIHAERCLKQLVEAMNYLPENYHLFIIGEGDFSQELENFALSSGLTGKISFTGPVSLDELPTYTKLADIGITLHNVGLSNYFSSPNKLFQYIHAGIPIIAQNFPFLKEVIEGYEIGCLTNGVDTNRIDVAIKSALEDKVHHIKMKTFVSLIRFDVDPVRIANAIKSALENESRYSRMKANTMIAKERFNWEKESHVFLEVYRKTCAEN
ncbi:MAG: glycosyltransferase [Bacteroidales bacterium]